MTAEAKKASEEKRGVAMSIEKKKAIRFQIEYDDGSIDHAEGQAAESIAAWYRSCEVMNCLHGAVYSGPKFEERGSRQAGPGKTRE